MKKIKLGKYKHYKGGEYEVIGTAFLEENLEEMVLYTMLYDSGDFKKGTIWIRPIKNFFEKVQVDEIEVDRFTYIGS